MIKQNTLKILEGLNKKLKNEFGLDTDPCSKCGEHMNTIHQGKHELELLCEDCHMQWLSELN